MAEPSTHPGPELVSDEVLTAMERDGWTPSQVRALIASYRRLKTGYLEIATDFDRFRMEVETTALDLAKLQDENEQGTRKKPWEAPVLAVGRQVTRTLTLGPDDEEVGGG